MTNGRRVKVSLSLPADVVASVDRQARAVPSGTRSAVAEEWLRRGARAQAEVDLRSEVVAYYASLDAEEQRENESIARGASRASRRLEIRDGKPSPRGKRSR